MEVIIKCAKRTRGARHLDGTPIEEIVRCNDCMLNYGNAHNCEFNPEDILCTYWECDGLTATDYCSRGINQEMLKNRFSKE